MTFDKVGKTEQRIPSTRAAHVMPCPLSGNRGSGRGINFGWPTDGHHGLDLAGRRIDMIACAKACGCRAMAADQRAIV
jgi:hypothetical protein